MAGISLSGLASGMDTDSLVSQILAAEGTGRTRLSNQQTKAEARVAALQGFQTKLTALNSAAVQLRSVTTWANTQKATSADETALKASISAGAASGTYSVQTLSLAGSAQRTFTYTPPNNNRAVTFGNVNITVAKDATLDDVVKQVNDAGGNVTAVNVQGKLVVSAKTTGAASTFAYSGTPLSQDSARAGTDFTYKVDGGATKSSSTNLAADGIPGVDLTGLKIGTTNVTVTAPAPDSDVIVSKVKAFVDAYNAVLETANAAIKEKPVKDATLSIDMKKGTLFGDQGLTRTISSLRNSMTTAVTGMAGTINELSDLGITTGLSTGAASTPDQIAGKLVIDEAKLKEALTSNPDSVKEFLGGKSGTNGFAQRLEGLVQPMTQAGQGYADRIDRGNSEVSRLKSSLTRFDERLERRETQLRAQFAAMEAALSKNQARAADFSAQLARLG